MSFWETVLAAVLGTSGFALLAWAVYKIRAWWLQRRFVWRLRPLGEGRFGLKYRGRKKVTEVTVLCQGPNYIGFSPQKIAQEMRRSSHEVLLPECGPDSWWQLTWTDSRGTWIARVFQQNGLQHWFVRPEILQKRGSDRVTELY